jgi:glycosyltransferase involved in cell wall biosynthesis
MKTVLHTESSPGFGGQEIRTLDEARWTRERGWRVLLACRSGGRLLEGARAAELEALAVPMTHAWNARALIQLIRIIRAEQVSLVHTHSSVDGWLGGMAARCARIPVVRTRHVSIPIRGGWNPVYTWLADRVMTSGEAIRRIVVQAGVAPERVIAIPAGVRLEDFPFRARSDLTARSLGLRAPVVGSVAMFRGSKGHAHLLEAFALVRAVHPAATLLLVGDGIRRAWVEGLAREAGLANAVVFTGFRRDVAALLACMDCFVLASTRTEGVPQSLLQAFAGGVPVVASDVGGVPEVVTDGVTGLLVKAESPLALAQAVETVLAEPAAAMRRAEAARALVEGRFSHIAAISRLLALYDEVLAGRPSGARGRP